MTKTFLFLLLPGNAQSTSKEEKSQPNSTHNRYANYGFTLLETLVTLGIMSIAGMALMSMNVTAMKSNKSSEIRSDLGDIKRTITNLISCDQTLGTSRPTTCSGGKKIELKNKDGKSLTTKDGKIGQWNIEASCESLGTPSTPGLSIYATKKKPDGTFMIDPIRNLPLDRNHPISLLYDPAVRLCGEYFASATTTQCPYGIQSVNFQDQTLVCFAQPQLITVSSCPSGQVMTGIRNSYPECVNLQSAAPTYTPPAPAYTPPAPAYTPPAPALPPRFAIACVAYTSGPCAGHCGGGHMAHICQTTWRATDSAMSRYFDSYYGACIAPYIAEPGSNGYSGNCMLNPNL